MSVLVEAKNLCFSYVQKPVWTDVNLTLAAGELVFLRGANGTGKSTLLRCLAGQLRPRDGEVCFLGAPLFVARRKNLAGLFFVPDVPAFYDDLTCREHLELISRVHQNDEIARKGLNLAKDLQIADALDVLPSALSRGMRYKLALALVLALHPQVLLLDEPFAPIDADSAQVLCREVSLLIAGGSAVLLSVHGDVSDIIPARTVYLDDGRLSEEFR